MKVMEKYPWRTVFAVSLTLVIFPLAAGGPHILTGTLTPSTFTASLATASLPGPGGTEPLGPLTVGLASPTTAAAALRADIIDHSALSLTGDWIADVQVAGSSWGVTGFPETSPMPKGFRAAPFISSGFETVAGFGIFNGTTGDGALEPYPSEDGTTEGAFAMANVGSAWSTASGILASNYGSGAGVLASNEGSGGFGGPQDPCGNRFERLVCHMSRVFDIYSAAVYKASGKGPVQEGPVNAPEPAAVTLVGMVLLAFAGLAFRSHAKKHMVSD